MCGESARQGGVAGQGREGGGRGPRQGAWLWEAGVEGLRGVGFGVGGEAVGGREAAEGFCGGQHVLSPSSLCSSGGERASVRSCALAMSLSVYRVLLTERRVERAEGLFLYCAPCLLQPLRAARLSWRGHPISFSEQAFRVGSAETSRLARYQPAPPGVSRQRTPASKHVKSSFPIWQDGGHEKSVWAMR